MTSGMRHLCALLLLVLASSIFCEAKQIAVIVDKANATVELSLPDLVKILKGENHRWPDGKLVTVILRDLSTPEMQAALQKIYKMQPDELKALIAAHKGAIVMANSEEELLKMVATTPGAIGLVDVYSITNRVSVLKIDGKLPLQQGYALKAN
jgi:ABC-type phosphate transport system substrate-binding protein